MAKINASFIKLMKFGSFDLVILFTNHPQRTMKRKFHGFLTLLMSTENIDSLHYAN